jgi:two-component system sensor kinase FixL
LQGCLNILSNIFWHIIFCDYFYPSNKLFSLITNTKNIDNATLQAIFNDAVDGMIVIDQRGIITLVNPAIERMFQYTSAELINKNISVLMPEPDRSKHDGYLKHHQQTGDKRIIGIGREVVGKRKDESTFPFFLSVSEVFLENDQKLYAGVLHDITELKRAQKAIDDYTKLLEQSNKELQEFAYISSHDLQEPLRKVQAFADRLSKTESYLLSDQGKDYLERILKASSRMQTLINDLLELSRISSKGNDHTPINLNSVLADVLDDIEVLLQKKNVKIEISNLSVVLGDETQMRQLFQNLITNAVKFSKEEIHPEIKIYELEQKKDGQLVTICVEDNGIGMDPKYQDKVFTIFQRLHGNKYEGSGIGLAVCKKIVNRAGGSISIESEPNVGTKFIITLKSPNQ